MTGASKTAWSESYQRAKHPNENLRLVAMHRTCCKMRKKNATLYLHAIGHSKSIYVCKNNELHQWYSVRQDEFQKVCTKPLWQLVGKSRGEKPKRFRISANQPRSNTLGQNLQVCRGSWMTALTRIV